MGYFCEGLQNWLDARENLEEVILLRKGSLLARTIDKYQRTLVSVSNCSPRVNRCRMVPVKLVLYTSRMSPFTLISRHLLLYSFISN